jgi:hypothetical protein
MKPYFGNAGPDREFEIAFYFKRISSTVLMAAGWNKKSYRWLWPWICTEYPKLGVNKVPNKALKKLVIDIFNSKLMSAIENYGRF